MSPAPLSVFNVLLMGLLPLVYDELRRLAAQKLAQEKPGQTLQATALVHEAYLRLVGPNAARSERSRQLISRLGLLHCLAPRAMSSTNS